MAFSAPACFLQLPAPAGRCHPHPRSAGVSYRPRVPPLSAGTSFDSFCDGLTGVWNSERTYHYLDPTVPAQSEVERSQTTFQVDRLPDDGVRQVLKLNGEEPSPEHTSIGISVSFDTFMEKQQQFVRSSTNLVFLPNETSELGKVSGMYLRDFGYEEREPTAAVFTFSPDRQELLMKTKYTKVVAVDSITLVSPTTRVRRILNFKRPENDDEPLKEVVLAGFGMELKLPVDDNQRLVDKA